LAPERNRTSKRDNQYKYWVLVRKITQYSFLAVFFIVLIATRKGQGAPSPGGLMMAFDPFFTILHLLSSRTFLSISALSIITLFLTLLLGRIWCGWICPLGTILEIFSFRRRSKAPQNPPERLRTVKFVILGTALIAALFSNLSLLFLDPLTILLRSGTIIILPGIDQVISQTEQILYPLEIFSRLVTGFDAAIRPWILAYEPVRYRSISLFLLFFMLILFLNVFSARFWCRYVCPLGGLLGLISRFSLFRRTVNSECDQCKVCERICPTATISSANNFGSDPGECTQCFECFYVCPHHAISLTRNKLPAARQDYDPRRRELIISGFSAVGLIGVFKASSLALHPHSQLLRPPGAVNSQLLSSCSRCGICMRVCPTGGLQPGLVETGIEGLWTPILIPEIGFCDYSCNSCGSACPTGAIPPLALDEKRLQVIGAAYIDEDRCIAWADHQDCIVCEEMCPVPQKAITLQESEFVSQEGVIRKILLPTVARERCIGCGICEFKCPVNGEAAIRVFISNTSLPLEG